MQSSPPGRKGEKSGRGPKGAGWYLVLLHLNCQPRAVRSCKALLHPLRETILCRHVWHTVKRTICYVPIQAHTYETITTIKIPHPTPLQAHPCPSTPRQSLICTVTVRWICISECYADGITECMLFWFGFFSPSASLLWNSSRLHGVIGSSFRCLGWVVLHCMDVPWFIRSPVGGQAASSLGLFQMKLLWTCMDTALYGHTLSIL